MKKNWTFAVIAAVLAIAAVAVAFIAGKKWSEDPDLYPDQDYEDEPGKEDNQDGKD